MVRGEIEMSQDCECWGTACERKTEGLVGGKVNGLMVGNGRVGGG